MRITKERILNGIWKTSTIAIVGLTVTSLGLVIFKTTNFFRNFDKWQEKRVSILIFIVIVIVVL
jgi:hypothetical protein